MPRLIQPRVPGEDGDKSVGIPDGIYSGMTVRNAEFDGGHANVLRDFPKNSRSHGEVTTKESSGKKVLP